MSLKRSAETHLTGPVAGLSGVASWCSRPPWTAPLAHPPRRGRGQPVPLGGRARGGLPTAPRPCAVPVDNRKRLTHRPLAYYFLKQAQEAGNLRPGEAWALPRLFSSERGWPGVRSAPCPEHQAGRRERAGSAAQTPSSW